MNVYGAFDEPTKTSRGRGRGSESGTAYATCHEPSDAGSAASLRQRCRPREEVSSGGQAIQMALDALTLPSYSSSGSF